MPNQDDQIEDMASSTVFEQDDNASNAAQQTAQADDAVSSPATGENEDKDLLSVVRDVVKESRSKKSEDAASPAESEGKDQTEAEGAEKKEDDEDFSDVPFNKHPRFQKLVREKNAFKEDATRYHNVVGFIEQAGLTAEEAADGLTIMGLAKTNPGEAWKQIQPWVQTLLLAAGEVLPDDLRARVQAGELSQEAAIELSRAKAQAKAVANAQSFREQQAERRQQTEAATAVVNAAVSWEQDRRNRDPNFEQKFVAIQKEVLFLQRTEGKPNTPQGVRAQLDKAYRAVNETIRPAPAAPQRQAVRPVTGGQVAGNQQATAPKSTLDIIRANRRHAS